jgi:3',5'-cyclic AMP phosphodiesterase CpdA
MTFNLSRRNLLISGAALATGSLLAVETVCADEAVSKPGRKRALRVAHLTDLHTQPELGAIDGVKQCLKHVQSNADKPDMIITGGDLIMDCSAQGFDRTKLQWDILMKVFKDNCSLPIEHCLGNHDTWGWNKTKSHTTGNEKGWGKSWATELLGMAKPYHSFDRAGWHFIVLDSIFRDGDGYIGKLDDPQREWLAADLKANTAKPTFVISHIPLLSICAMLGGDHTKANAWNLGWNEVHQDGQDLHRQFTSSGNVRLCVSGHIHRRERIEIGGLGAPEGSLPITYICDGAVSGSWWNGRKDRCDEGYGVFDLFDDGSFEHNYMTYGWTARA